jgi:arginyl-tRNA synthetase
MTYKLLLEEARRIIDSTLDSIGFHGLQYTVQEPPSEQMGELSSNVCFQVAKAKGISPGAAANEFLEHVRKDNFTYISSIEAHPSGYLNFKVDVPAFASRTLESIASDDSYGLPRAPKSEKISVEHTSVNPNKALHIGHLRNVVIGDSLVRLLMAAGHRVHVLNYVDDTGVQVADVALGIMELGFPARSEGKKFDHYIGDDVYVSVNNIYRERPELLERRKELSMLLERGVGRVSELASQLVHDVLVEQLKTCWRVGAEYDLLNFESHFLRAGYWEEVFERLKALGVVKLEQDGKFKGCWVMAGGGDEEEKVLVRSDGTAVYAAKDIPYAAWKLGILKDRFGYTPFVTQSSGRKLWSTSVGEGEAESLDFTADKTISVIGVEQVRPQKFVKQALLSLSSGGTGYHHLAYERVFLSQKTAEQIPAARGLKGPVGMKGRAGLYVNADDVLDALKKKAVEETRKRHKNAPDEWVDRTAESIAVSAIRYALLRQDLNKTIVFDLEDSLRLEGDTGPYLMYTYARACSILKKLPEPASSGRPKQRGSLEASEKNLVLTMSRMEFELEDAVSYLNPKSTARYCYQLAMEFNNFYESCPVIEAEPDVRDWRAELVRAFKKVFSKSLDLIGVVHPESI